MDLHDGLEATLSLMKNEFQEIEIVKEYDKLPLVYCQPGQMNQVFMNIILNAVQALDGKGTIRITTSGEKNQVVVRIADNGPGIDPGDLAKIFDPFFTTKPVGTGTGLGLSISYGIVESHGGKLQVESELGRGTAFIITLPVKEGSHEDKNSYRG